MGGGLGNVKCYHHLDHITERVFTKLLELLVVPKRCVAASLLEAAASHKTCADPDSHAND